MNSIELQIAASIAISSAYLNKSPVAFQQCCDYVMEHYQNPDIHFPRGRNTYTKKVTDAGDAWILLHCTDAGAFNKVGLLALTYPWDRTTLTTRRGQLRRGTIS